ncbi:MAG: hypothetical protein IPI67_38735 [Myxococcales bacterium]|nr:hypothetical protein [Myxococcales bacterium]
MWRPSLRLCSGTAVLLTWLLTGCGSKFESTSDEPGAAACNGPGALSDNFDDGELSDAFVSQLSGSGMQVEESAGELVFTPGDSGGGGSRESRYAIDVRGGFAVVEVPEVSGGLSGKSVQLTLKRDNSSTVSMTALDDNQNPGAELLSFDVTTAAGTTKATAPYDATQHRWWRIGEKDGVLGFGASPDGQKWTTYHEVPTPSFVAAALLRLGMNDKGTVTPVGQVRFDNLNPKSGSFCGIDRLRESFDAELGEAWAMAEDTDCSASVTGSSYEATVLPGGTGSCSITTRHGYDLAGRGLTLAFDTSPAAPSGITVTLTLSSGPTDALTFEHYQGKLKATTSLGTVTSNGSVELADGPSWWRIRESGGRIEFEVSSDGKTFDSVNSVIVGALPPRFLASLRLRVSSAQPADTKLVLAAIN